MSKDYYQTLGVSKTATKDEIKKAFRKKAHEFHPDKQGGNEAKFKEANEAYQVLSDDQKRAQYDRFGSTGPNMGSGGFQGGQGFGGFDPSDFARAGFSGFQNGQGGMEFDLNDIFEGFFGGGFNGRRVRQGRHIQLGLTLSFQESILGTKKKIKIPGQSVMANKKEVEIDIPGGIEHGQKMKLSGYGEPMEGGQPGDLYLIITVPEHPVYRKEGYHLVRTLEVKLTDAILGAKYDIETLDGNVKVKIPKGINTGTLLRIKGEGVKVNTFQRGDILLQVKVLIPDGLTKEQKKLIEELQEKGL